MRVLTLLAASALCAAALIAPASAEGEKSVTVFKSPWCGCCHEWAQALADAGYEVRIRDMEDVSVIKRQAGVPEEMEGCHTAVLGKERKYVLEGHVPLQAIDKLMSERPDIHGLAVAGMPMGSLGMDYDPAARYDVHALLRKRSEPPQIYMRMGQGG